MFNINRTSVTNHLRVPCLTLSTFFFNSTSFFFISTVNEESNNKINIQTELQKQRLMSKSKDIIYNCTSTCMPPTRQKLQLSYITSITTTVSNEYNCTQQNVYVACVYVVSCCLHLKMEYCSCARGRQWCGIIHYH